MGELEELTAKIESVKETEHYELYGLSFDLRILADRLREAHENEVKKAAEEARWEKWTEENDY